jgi:hypothetical protein
MGSQLMFHHSSFLTHRILVGFRMHLKISLKITHLAYCSLSLLFFMYLLVFGIAWLTILYEKTSVMSNIHKKMKLWELEVVQPLIVYSKEMDHRFYGFHNTLTIPQAPIWNRRKWAKSYHR